MKDGLRSFAETLIYGLFPEIIATRSPDKKKELLTNYRNTYFTRDIMQMANLENLDGLRGIFAQVCRSIGSHLEVSHFARETSLSVPTAKKYLNTLYQSELAFKLHGFHYGPAKRFMKAAKTYFAHNGIIESFNIRLNDGQLLENFVIAELEKRRKLGYIKADQFYYHKSAAGREIDLIFESRGILHAVEIKATKAPASRDIANLREFLGGIPSKAKGYLFYLGEGYSEMDGINLLPVFSLFSGKG